MTNEVIEIDENGKVHTGGDFVKELESLLNSYSQENGSNTPDFILAGYLLACLRAWNAGIVARERWYGRTFFAGNVGLAPATAPAADQEGR